MFGQLGIPPELLAEAHVARVTDGVARTAYGIVGPSAMDMAGIMFPYHSPVDGHRCTARLRRDHPEMEDDKPRNKYVCPWGDNRHLYFPPDASEKLKRPDIPIVLIEAEKSALALTAWAERLGMDILPLGMGGCWSWRGVVGKTEDAKGARVDVLGPLDDLHVCDRRRVYILLDTNAATNLKVAAARRDLASELRKRRCQVLICELPLVEGVNGPDDYISVAGDEAMANVFAAAHPPTRKLIVMPAPKAAVPPLTAEEAAARTSELLETVYEWINNYVIVSHEQATILACWELHTYVIDAAEYTPYLHVTGPQKEIGKSLLMEVLADLACNPRTASGTTPAALVRVVDKFHPTLFLDEIDASTKGNPELAQTQRGILDAGFKRVGGEFYKCEGKDNEVQVFNAFGPKCFAGIGELPGTIASRSIIIEMRRKLRSERIARRRSRIAAQFAAPIRAELEQWAAGVIDQLKAIEPAPIDTLNDRANDGAEILLAIAQLAGGDWPQRLTAALLAVYGSEAAEDTSVGVVLLTDIRDIFAERGASHIPSKELASALCEIEGRLWPEWSRGRGLSANNLARQLSKYHIHPATIRFGSETAKGYRRADFDEVWERYCPYPPPTTVTTAQPASSLAETAFSNRNTPPHVTDSKSASDPHKQRVVTDVTFHNPEYRQKDIFNVPAEPGEAPPDTPPEDEDTLSVEAILGEQTVPTAAPLPAENHETEERL